MGKWSKQTGSHFCSRINSHKEGWGCGASLERTSNLVFGQKTENIIGQPETNKQTEKALFFPRQAKNGIRS